MANRQRTVVEIPYPAVFHDWRSYVDVRIATSQAAAGIRVETMHSEEPGLWRGIELTERDACLLAASLVKRSAWVNGEPPNRALEKLAQRIVNETGKL